MNSLRVIIVKTSALGDILQALAVAKVLKEHKPDCQITWIVDEKNAELLECFDSIDKVVSLPLYGLKQGFFSFFKTLKIIYRKLKFLEADILFDLQGNSKSALIAYFCKVSKKVGFGRKEVAEWPNLLVTNHKISYCPLQKNMTKRYLAFAEYLLQKPLNVDQQGDLPRRNINRLIMICPASNWKNKIPDHEEFERFLLKIQTKYGFDFIFVGVQSDVFPAFINAITYPKLEWNRWINLMKKVDMVIAADSCALHLAAICQVPTWSFFGPSSQKVYKPMGLMHAGIQGKCPFNISFEKRCPSLRTCQSGACLKQLSHNDYFDAFCEHWETLFNNKSKST